MPKIHTAFALATLLAMTGLAAPSALREAFTGHPPEPPPCPPCHCRGGVLDCTGVDIGSTAGVLDASRWNVSGFEELLLDGTLDAHAPPRPPGSLSALPPSGDARLLSLRRRGLSVVASGAFVGMPALRALDLSHNELTADAVRADVLRGPWRADSYEPLGLETLDLSHNALHALPRRVLEHLAGLRTLRLDGNPLRVLDRGTQVALAGAASLQVLSLSGCGLRALSADLSSALPRGLLALDLSRNALATVPHGLPSSLRRLVLDGNPVRALPPGDSLVSPFAQLGRLEELSLSYMPVLEALEVGAFFGLANLRALSCSHNPVLRHVDPAAFSHLGPSRTLTEVSLRNNSLTGLDPGLLVWRRLTFLDVADNPWHCSCNFTSWAGTALRPVNLNARGEMRCSTPAELSGVPLLNATASACALRQPGQPPAPGRPSLFANALLLALTVTLVASVVLLARRLLGDDRPGRPLGRAARAPRRADSMKTPLYVAAPTEDPLPFPTDACGQGAALCVGARRANL